MTVAAVHREGVIAAIRQAGKGGKADFGYLMRQIAPAVSVFTFGLAMQGKP